MARTRSRLDGWTYDDTRQELHTPSGQTIPLRAIAQRLQDDLACRHDFAGAWAGWRMRGDRLIPPHSGRNSPVLKPDTAPRLAQWIAEARTPPPMSQDAPRLRLVHSRSMADPTDRPQIKGAARPLLFSP